MSLAPRSDLTLFTTTFPPVFVRAAAQKWCARKWGNVLLRYWEVRKNGRKHRSSAFPSSSFLLSLTRGSITAKPEEQVKALRSAFAKALGSAEFQDEAKKKTFEADLLAGEELQALAKEVVVQPPEIIGQIRKLMGECDRSGLQANWLKR